MADERNVGMAKVFEGFLKGIKEGMLYKRQEERDEALFRLKEQAIKDEKKDRSTLTVHQMLEVSKDFDIVNYDDPEAQIRGKVFDEQDPDKTKLIGFKRREAPKTELGLKERLAGIKRVDDKVKLVRGEHRSESNRVQTNEVIAAYNRVKASADKASAAGDLALIFNYMKMLDPGSTVREGEFATAQNAAGWSQRIRAQYNAAVSGKKLEKGQRDDFVNRSDKLKDAALETQTMIDSKFIDLAKTEGIDPARIFGSKARVQTVLKRMKKFGTGKGEDFTPGASPDAASGMVEQGNIDTTNRSVVNLKGGGQGTIRSMSFNDEGVEVLIPTIINGQEVSEEEAIAHYKRTGEHLGKFKTPQDATRYAQGLSDQIGQSKLFRKKDEDEIVNMLNSGALKIEEGLRGR